MVTKSIEARIREARLIVARPEQVLVELEKYGEKLKEDILGADEHLEKSLLARNDPLINLGLAQHAREKEVVAALYQKSRTNPTDHLQDRYLRGLRLACLSNQSTKVILTEFPVDVIGEDEYLRLLREGDDEETDALFTNPTLKDEIIEQLYKNEGPFASLSDERRRRLVLLSIYNPRLTTNEESDEGPDLGYMGIQRAIIAMLANAPTTEHWLHTIRQLIDALNPNDILHPDWPITPILERWERVPISENSIFKNGFYTPLSMRDEVRCLIAAMYGQYYSKGKNGEYEQHTSGGPDSPDVALRCAYYGNARLTEKEMKDGFARDGATYVFSALYNDSIYYHSSRKLLENEQLNDEGLLELYKSNCAKFKKRWPLFDPHPVSDLLIEEESSESKEMTKLTQLEATLTGVVKKITSLQTWIFWGFIALGALVLFR